MLKRLIPVFMILLAHISPSHAHLAIDHLKDGLASRFDQVAESHQLSQEEKAQALSQLRTMQTKYTQLVSLNQIPSQKQEADKELKSLNQDLQEFDKTLHKITSSSNKS